MARRRMIDPDFWENDNVNSLSYMARLFLIGMISHADDYGKGRMNLATLRSKIFQQDDISLETIEGLIEEIKEYISIKIYTVGSSNYYIFENWKKLQCVNKPQFSPIPYPLENQSSDDSMNDSVNPSGNDSVNHSRPNNDSDSDSDSLYSDTISSSVIEPPVQKNKPVKPRNGKSKNPDTEWKHLLDTADGFSDKTRIALSEWFEYKQQRKDAYTPIGIIKLISRARKEISKHGEGAFVDCVDKTIASNYQGIVWDWLNKGQGKQKVDDEAYRI